MVSLKKSCGTDWPNKEYDRIVQFHCKQNDSGYLLIPRFMLSYVRYGLKVFNKAPVYILPGLTITQFCKDNELLYGILEWVFDTDVGVEVFYNPIQTEGRDDGTSYTSR
jgi:hypothetical protein